MRVGNKSMKSPRHSSPFRPVRSHILTALIVAACAVCLVAQALAENKETREFKVPGHGAVQLKVPVSWKSEMQQSPNNLPPTIALNPASGKDFEIMITPVWSPKGDKDFNSNDSLKKMITEGDWKNASPQAEETELVLKSIKGDKARGYYFLATDRAPKPGEYKYMIRAWVGVGDLALSFTLLSNKKDSQAIQDALSMLRDVRQVKD